jgi:DHA1 family tetracycline resistance protein-like MFS transporter
MTPLGVIVLIVLVDLLGFSLVMPLLAPFAKQYGFNGWQIGLLFSAYPMCQLVAGPILGHLSDRYGRRPLLIFSQAGTALSFLILGLSRDFSVMLLARMLDGASGGNILVAQAYVADVTVPEHRARGMGLIGMAFGVGFVLGPLLGGLLLSLPLAIGWRLRLPFLFAAAFSTLAWILVLTRLPEPRSSERASREPARVISRRGVVDTLTIPGVGRLVLTAFLAVFAFSAFEATFALFLQSSMKYDARQAAFAFAAIGFLSAAVQGGLIRRLVPRFGEMRLIVAGLMLAVLGFAGLALVLNSAELSASMVLLGVGQGLITPSISGLLSRITPANEQGAVFGTLTSSNTLARMISYSTSNVLLGEVLIVAPYWVAFGVDLLALALAGHTLWRFRPESTHELVETAQATPRGIDSGCNVIDPGNRT